MSRFSGTRLFVAAVTFAVAGVVTAAIVMLGSPAEQRRIRLDQRRVSDLMSMQYAVTQYVEEHKALPKDVAAIANAPGFRRGRNDPETGAPYEYEVIDERSYRLCATFARRSESTQAAGCLNGKEWEHEAGRQCFVRTKPSKDETGSDGSGCGSR